MTQTVELRVVENRFISLAALSYKPTLARMASYLGREIVGDMFDTEGASRGHTWEPLAESTRQKKARKGRTTAIMQHRGLLRRSFGTLSLTDSALVYGIPSSMTPYAKYPDSDAPRQQKASGGPRLPQRKLLRIIPRDLATLERFLREDIERTAGGEPT